MAITVTSQVGSQTGAEFADLSLGTFGASPVTGDTIVIYIAWFSSGNQRNSIAPTDSYGNLYQRIGLTDLIFTNFGGLGVWRAENIRAGAGFVPTIHLTGAALLGGVARVLHSSVPLPIRYNGDATVANTSGTTTATTGTAAPAPVAASIFIAGVTDIQTNPAQWTVTAGWNDRGVNQTNNLTGQDLGTEDFVNSAATGLSATWTGPNGTFGTYLAALASFSERAASAFVVPRSQMPVNQRM